MTLDTRLDAAIHWAHPRLEFHISVWFQGCEQWADLLSEVLRSRHKEGRRAKTTLLQDKDTSGGGGMVSLWLCLCVFVCLSLSVCLCVFTLSLFLFLCVSISLSLLISVPDERWTRIAWMWMTTDQRKGEIIILRKGRHLLSLLLFIIIIYYYYSERQDPPGAHALVVGFLLSLCLGDLGGCAKVENYKTFNWPKNIICQIFPFPWQCVFWWRIFDFYCSVCLFAFSGALQHKPSHPLSLLYSVYTFTHFVLFYTKCVTLLLVWNCTSCTCVILQQWCFMLYASHCFAGSNFVVNFCTLKIKLSGLKTLECTKMTNTRWV